MRIALVAFFLLCGVGVFAESQPPSPSKSEPSSQKQENTQHKNDTPQVLVKTPTATNIEPVKPANPESKIYNCQKDNDSPSEWWMIVLTAILAFVTYRLVVETRKLVTETATASKRQAIQTEESLDISRQAADAAKKSADALAKIERAYIFVSATMGDKKLLNGEFIYHDAAFNLVYLSMSASIKNHGKTPAILRKVYGGWAVENSAPTKANVSTMSEDKIPTGIILSADREPYILEVGDPAQNERFHVTLEQWQQIVRREKTFFLYGRVEYKDILGNDRDIGFCWQYCPGDETTGFTIADSDLNYCDE